MEENCVLIKKLFQFVALGLFVFQMQNSIKKYYDQPIIQQTSTITLDSIEKPVLFICQDDQFNYATARFYGYKGSTNFLIGKTTSGKITWKGEFSNISFSKLKEFVFDVDYSDYSTFSKIDGKYKNAELDYVNIAPYGFCLKVRQTESYMKFYTNKKSKIILVDPARSTKVRLSRKDSGLITLNPITNGLYEFKVYEIELSQFDTRLYDGITCIDYERLGTSYEECIMTAWKANFVKWYDCLPPWISDNSSLTCEQNTTIRHTDPIVAKLIREELSQFTSGLELDILQHCLRPCITMDYKFNLVEYRANYPNYAYTKFKIMDEIVVYTDALAYDMFSLVVDLGSALGLWLGLSAISIFNTLLELWSVIQMKYFH